MPFFSIIIPVYKTEIYLERCLRSVKEQTFQDFECIVINDGSPGMEEYLTRPKTDLELLDSTIDMGNHPKEQCFNIFNHFCGKDERFRLIQKSNEGLGPTKNRGLLEAEGKRLVVLDSDDFLELDYLEKAYNALKHRPKNIIIHGLLKTYTDGEFDTFEESQKFLPSINNLENILVFPTWTVTPINYFWKLDLIRKYDIKYRFKNKGEDTAFVIENIIAHYKEYGKFKFESIDAYYIYRQFENQMTKSDGFEIELFEHTTKFMKKILPELRKIGLKYEVLGRLFVLRFSLYRARLLASGSLTKLFASALAKLLTILAILIAGTKKM